MKLKYEFEIMTLDDEILAVPIGDNAHEFNGLLKVNEIAAFMLKLAENETTVNEVAAALSKVYEGTREELIDCVGDFVMKLNQEELLADRIKI